jgi:ribosomal protein L11 methylase PrmA
MNARLARDPASFRDPSGYVFTDGTRVLRGLAPAAAAEYAAAQDSGLLREAVERQLLIAGTPLPADAVPGALCGARGETLALAVEHPRLPLVSYPYEWTFGQLRDAALAHLDLQLLALGHGFELSDGSAYNLQFAGGGPLHIDVLSLRRWRAGRPWEGYHQFCRQFLFPLLVQAEGGLPFQRLYRGSLEGIGVDEVLALVPAWRRWSGLNLLLHVQLQAGAVRRAAAKRLDAAPVRVPTIPQGRYRALLQQLRDWIAALQPARGRRSYWSDYAAVNSYSSPQQQRKAEFVQGALRAWGSRSVLDVGGNAGTYCEAALDAGAMQAVCLDGDIDALELAYGKRKAGRAGLMPLVGDWCDPSPAQGWAGRERRALRDRLRADTVLALALVHHVVIGRNVPLAAFVDELFVHGERLVVEFVPKSDPMVQGLLRGRDDVFADYDEPRFLALLAQRAEITGTLRLEEGGRMLVACTRR